MGTAVDDIVAALPESFPADRRFVIALAGPPASGKSTLADALAQLLEDQAVVVGLDAFHFDDAILSARGHLERKGAPHTFDVDGYAALLQRLRHEPEETIALPVFDRSLELTRSAAAIAGPRNRVVITEGNWLLLKDAPWPRLRRLFDLTIFVTADLDTVDRRINKRWLGHGFDQATAARRAADNDLPNARLAIERSSPGDLSIHT